MTAKARTIPTWQVWATGLVLLVASQLIVWSAIAVGEQAARPAGITMRAHVNYTLFDAEGRPLSASGALTAEPLAYLRYRGAGAPDADHAVFNILFTLEDNTVPQALMVTNRDNIAEISLNGVPIQPAEPLRRLRGDLSLEAGLYPLPARFLQNGTNVLFIKTAPARRAVTLAPFAVGPAAGMEASYGANMVLQSDVPVAGVAILLFTAALCLLVNWPPQDRLRIGWLVAFLTVNALSTLVLTLAPSEGLPVPVLAALVLGTNMILGLSAVRYAVLDSGRTDRWPFLVTGACGGLVLLLAAAAWVIAAGGLGPPLLVAIKGSTLAAALLCALAAGVLLVHTARTAGERWLDRLVMILCLSVFALDRVAQNFTVFVPGDTAWPVSLYWSPVVGPLLGTWLLVSLARQAGEARREVAESNLILEQRLRDQDAELDRQYQARRQMLQRQVVLEERQRIVRDMHDGIGGQLLGLMMQVRSGEVDRVSVEQGLQASLADLRMIVDAMDSAEEGLATVLSAFEHRAQSQVEAAGMAFRFDQTIDPAVTLGPRPTLQVLRILQEAIANAMRHSKAGTIAVTAKGHDGAVTITIADDGQGLPRPLRRGRGLTSMETRARSLGGTLSVDSGPGGSTLTLVLPVQPPETGP